MLRIIFSIIAIIGVVLPCSYAEQPSPETPVQQLKQAKNPVNIANIQKVYVSEFNGPSNIVERFKFLLEEELERNGLTVVNNSSDADAFLSGVLSVNQYTHSEVSGAYNYNLGIGGASTENRIITEVYVVAKLISASERNVFWKGNFEHRPARVWYFKTNSRYSERDDVKNRAIDVAEAIRKAQTLKPLK